MSSYTRPDIGYPYDVTVTRRENEGFGFVIISSVNKAGSTIGEWDICQLKLFSSINMCNHCFDSRIAPLDWCTNVLMLIQSERR